ncbi:MAG: hypothetical protein ACPG5P_08260, partial [Saprospiraceae bacterium]
MEKELMKVSIRQGAIYIAKSNMESQKDVNHTTSVLVANASKLGFTFSEELLRAINGLTPRMKMDILDTLKTITGVKKNWTPLVKGWDVPTGETRADHAITFLANLFKSKRGTRLECGHVIPENTFPLERYNGCPYCGTPFEFGKIEKMGQGSKLKVLELWDEAKMMSFFKDLLASKTALDATQVDSLKTLLKHFTLPEGMEVGMKETMVLVVDTLIEQDKGELAKVMFKSPADILRYLWYKKTGFLQIIEPKTLVQRISKNNKHIYAPADTSGIALVKSKADMKLKYSRKEGKMVAAWMNHLALSVEKSCEIMHAKRGMWVRFIRALRLAEYSHRKGFEKLESLLDVFYNQAYEVWQGRVN